MSLGYDQPLYILAADRRGSFQKKMFGIPGDPTPEEAARISDAKGLIWDGMVQALSEGTPREHAGILIDEQFGADIARKAEAEFDPDFSKVLVRYNPEGDPGMNERQAERLKRLSDRLHAHDRKFLFELLVPAEPHQLEAVGGDTGRYDTEVRPGLMLRSLAELQEAGVEPDIWKIEGLDRREDCRRISDQARSGGRDGVGLVVLGRGADGAKVHHWLRQGPGCPVIWASPSGGPCGGMRSRATWTGPSAGSRPPSGSPASTARRSTSASPPPSEPA
jgi:myo-inositol catabolism protein IolC